MILLQAALGFGLLIYEIEKKLLFIGIPLLTILLTTKSVYENKKKGLSKQPISELFRILLANLLYSVLVILGIGTVIIFLLFSIVDLSDS